MTSASCMLIRLPARLYICASDKRGHAEEDGRCGSYGDRAEKTDELLVALRVAEGGFLVSC